MKRLAWIPGLFVCAALVVVAHLTAQQAQTPQQQERQRLAQQDRQRIMDLLGITSIPPGAQSSNPDTYDESKAEPFPALPHPLFMNDGRRVRSADMWWKERRPEIAEDFEREVYGRTPRVTPRVRWEVANTVADGRTVTKTLVGHVDNSSYPAVTVDIQLTLVTPAGAKGPVPVIMQLNFPFTGRGRGAAPAAAGAPAAQPAALPSWQQQVLAKGWGWAQIVPTSIQGDSGADLTTGIIGLVNRGQPRKLDDWGALKAWAWGASRALDYFETDKAVDATRVGIQGHSRYGKAAIVAMAFDQRFAIGYISSSGAAGAKLHRRKFGEVIENVLAANEYHWMAGNYFKYGGNWDALPVDSHSLIAMIAPRPVFLSAGATEGDGWVDAKGSFLAASAAFP
ncbi:MAG TPA: hypothetical protein VFZ73_06845, partial [Gemmatimonadaceae bacterium]